MALGKDFKTTRRLNLFISLAKLFTDLLGQLDEVLVQQDVNPSLVGSAKEFLNTLKPVKAPFGSLGLRRKMALAPASISSTSSSMLGWSCT